MKIKLPVKLRNFIVSHFESTRNHFDDEQHLFDLLRQGIPTDHFLALQRLRRTKLDKITDVELIMLCGVFDFVFTAGCYPYSSDENFALNELGDAILEVKHS